MSYNTEKIRLAYKSKYNFKRENQVILLMITYRKKWHYLAVKKYSTKEKLKKHGKVSNDHDYGYVEMPDKDNKTLKCNHREKSLKAPFITDADLECLLEKMHSCQNNLEKPYTGNKN